MLIIINGEERTVSHSLLRDILVELDYPLLGVAIELNGTILPMDTYESTQISAADRLEIVCFVGGG